MATMETQRTETLLESVITCGVFPCQAEDKGASATVNSGSTKSAADDNRKRKRTYRHSEHQIKQMEALFKYIPDPDAAQRKELASRIGLEQKQVLFWFQNKRIQIKAEKERQENFNIRTENQKVAALNARYKEALKNNSCPVCSGLNSEMLNEEKILMLVNTRLKEQLKILKGSLTRYIEGHDLSNIPMISHFANPSPHLVEVEDTFNLIKNKPLSNRSKHIIDNLVHASTEEFKAMSFASASLWTRISVDGTTDLLNEVEYLTRFPDIYGPTPIGYTSECSIHTDRLQLSANKLIKILMDANEWSVVFSSIVLRATTLDVLYPGVDYDGALHVMVAEYQVPTPSVPTREVYFARYCKKTFEGVWTVVDVSLDNVHPMDVKRCHKRPSGCRIEQMADGFSKVTWIEHVQVDYQGVSCMYKNLLASGLGFGAKRWVSTLDRQLQRAAFTLSPVVPTTDDFNKLLMSSTEGRGGVLKLAERMMISFNLGINGSKAGTWKTLRGDLIDDIRLMIRRNADDPSLPSGTLLSASISIRLPVPPKKVFEYLSNPNSRPEWDILTNGNFFEQVCHFSNGQEAGNYVSIQKVHMENTSYSNLLILQECCTDPLTSYVVYAPSDIGSMKVVLSGGDPNSLPLLPCGFVVLPDEPSLFLAGGSCGSLLTVSFQMLASKSPTEGIDVPAISTTTKIVKCAIEKIKATFSAFGPCIS